MTDQYSAWNPGLEPDIPHEYLDRETIYLPENVSSRLADVAEISAQTGLPPEELVVFRPERLVLHELIVRVTADIVVLEGDDEEDLGKNFRHIARTILNQYLQPHMEAIRRAYVELQQCVYERVQQELCATLLNPPVTVTKNKGSFWSQVFGRPRKSPARQESIEEKEYRVVSGYKEKGLEADDPLEHALYRSLYRVLSSIASTRGVIGSDQSFLVSLVSNHICNRYGSRIVGEMIQPHIDEAIRREGYPLIPDAKAPILISLKGASAAGKSSLRPMLKQMMPELGIEPEGYATISPDIWRRLLLDYESLGAAYKYAGRFTSNEVNIVDSKLDHYIRDKAGQHHSIPHLLVDRFRFDSFSSEKISLILHGTYAKYVDTMYMYFVVTPPEATVERGWERGLARGRYKAVEDFLGHSVEAYVGMPKIFFKWLVYDKPLFKYEFLDNSVPKGCYPRTIAVGTQSEINIFNPLAFIDIERYQKINIKAKAEREVYPEVSVMAIANNIGFLQECIRRIPAVNFLDEQSNNPYVCVRNGQFKMVDAGCFSAMLEVDGMVDLFALLAPQLIGAQPDVIRQ